MPSAPSTKHHPAFRKVSHQNIESLSISVEEYEHVQTGAQHIHLSADNPENVFLVALRTVPKDSTGVAHILEHTALCGSERYPVRDPFFMMTRRSLNTFMNAFTSSDWTAYPFASVNRKDFNNLLDVYLDAVFFSRLDKLDFAQEGHRLEFAESDNPESDLEYKGVVYNEMKGAMSSVNSQLWQTLTKYLFPTNTYHHNSGGEPNCIPDLSYDELVAFYKTHYHPSNAIFMTYGDIPAGVHQAKFEEQALSQFERLESVIGVADEKRYAAPVHIEEQYPLDEELLTQKTHVVTGWLLGKSTNLEESLTAHLLSSLLLDNSASPLLHALETADFAQAPSPLCGLEDSQKEMLFVCGVAGTDREHSDTIDALIMDTLKKVVKEGIPNEDIEAALHQLELQQREVGGDGYPYGLQLILSGLTAATHRGDPAALLNVDSTLAILREKIKDPDFIPSLIQKWLIDNPHKVRLTLIPSTTLGQIKESQERAELASIKAALSEQEKAFLIQQAADLKERQSQVDDESILPKVTLDDVPAKETLKAPHTVRELPIGGSRLYGYDAGTNGLVYQQVACELPQFTEQELTLLPYYTSLLTEVGIANKDYLAVQRWQTQVCGSIGGFNSMRALATDTQKLKGFFVLSGKALNDNHKALSELMDATLCDARFDETTRLQELIAQIRSHKEQSITGNGHGLAMQGASKGISIGADLSFRLGGLEAIRNLKKLDDTLESPNAIEAFQKTLTAIHNKMQAAPRHNLVVSEKESLDSHLATFESIFDQNTTSKNSKNSQFAAFEPIFTPQKTNDAWLTNAQVNFCARAYATVPSDHSDAAPLVVLGNLMRNGYLHRTIREQGGAYGGGASQDNNSGAFRFYSYRDPRMEGTLDDFDKAIDWTLETSHSWQSIEEAILGVVSNLDKPDSPAGGAKREFNALLNDRTEALRQRFRERILAVDESQLKHVTETYLTQNSRHTCVITDKSKQSEVEAMNLNVEML